MPDLGEEFDTTVTAQAGAVCPLVNPKTGVPLIDEETKEPVSITMAGRDSDIYRKAENAIRNTRAKAAANRPGSFLTAEQVELEGTQILAMATLSWTHIKVDGEALECNAKNARTLYTRFPWIREQVDLFVADRGNYLGGAKSS